MFPLKSSDAYIEPTGKRSTLGAKLAEGGGGGSELPEYSEADAGKVLTVGDDGELEWDEKGSAGGPVYIGLTVPSSDLGEDGNFYMQYKNVYEKTALIPPQVNGDNVIVSNEGLSFGWRLFDGNDTTFWSTGNDINTNQYCGFDFKDSPQIVTGVTINPRQWNGVVQIHDFKIQASNDNETWVDILTDSIPNNATYAGTDIYFDVPNDTAYRYYRLFVINANTSQTITVFEMQLYQNTGDVIDIAEYKTYKKVSGTWVEIT